MKLLIITLSSLHPRRKNPTQSVRIWVFEGVEVYQLTDKFDPQYIVQV